MKWSWRIGRIAGIDLYVHATFPLLFVWIAVTALRAGATVTSVLFTIGLTLAVFAIVVLHECGHALTARHFGIQTRDITLLPIGGIARLERMPREPRQELLIALAGPAVNLVLAALLYVALLALGGAGRLTEIATGVTRITPAAVLAQLLAINIWLAVFNLIPAFPMDGGRALRALLAMRSRDYVKATAAAAQIGRAFALLFALLGIFVIGNPTLALIAVFVWIAATTEAAAVQTSTALENVRLADLMITDVRTLAPDDPLERAARLTIEGFQQDFPVVENGALVGMLTRRDLVRGLTELGSNGTVRAVMQRDFPTANLGDTPEDALKRLSELRGTALPVVRGRELVGVLTADNISEFLTLRAAQRGARPAAAT
jgi:Zn-dependent protease